MNPTLRFNNNILNNVANFTIDSIIVDPPRRVTNTHERAYEGGSVSTIQKFADRTIHVTAHFTGTYESMLTSLRTLDSYLVGVNKEIRFDINGDFVVFVGHVASVQQSPPKGGYRKMTIIFEIPEVYGESQVAKTGQDLAVIISDNNTAVVNNGSYDALPTITLDINSFTGAGVQEVAFTIGGYSITVQQTFTTLDQLVIDCDKKQTTLNGVEVEMQGKYPHVPLGNSNVIYTDSFTARNVDINVEFKERY